MLTITPVRISNNNISMNNTNHQMKMSSNLSQLNHDTVSFGMARVTRQGKKSLETLGVEIKRPMDETFFDRGTELADTIYAATQKNKKGDEVQQFINIIDYYGLNPNLPASCTASFIRNQVVGSRFFNNNIDRIVSSLQSLPNGKSKDDAVNTLINLYVENASYNSYLTQKETGRFLKGIQPLISDDNLYIHLDSALTHSYKR